MKPKTLEEVDEEMARNEWLEESVENSVRCPICRGVLKLSIATPEETEEEESD